eukprot:4172231-Pyramimonas_sp.AAC.1
MSVAFSSRLEKEARESVHEVQACIRGRPMTDQILEAGVWGVQQCMLGRDLSCLFMTGFAAAFPSIAISWLLRVLVLMQVHPGVVGFFKALHSDNLGT